MDTKGLWYFRRNALCSLLCGSSSSLQEILCTSTTRLVRRSCTTGSVSCCFQDLSSLFGLWHHVLLFFVSCKRTSVCVCVFLTLFFSGVILWCFSVSFFFLYPFLIPSFHSQNDLWSLLLSEFCIWKIVKQFFPPPVSYLPDPTSTAMTSLTWSGWWESPILCWSSSPSAWNALSCFCPRSFWPSNPG